MPAVSDQAMPSAHDATAHQTHKDVINRLKRADGHLQAIIGMIDTGRDCTEIAQQMHAVIRALEKAKTVLIHDHIDHCLEKAVGPIGRGQQATVRQFKDITKYL